MAEPHEVLNGLSVSAAADALRGACGARRWVERMLAARPFASREALWALADREWRAMDEADLLEAFSHHPQIGEDLADMQRRFGANARVSEREQAGAIGADPSTLIALRDFNRAYRERFGFIFIVCASGKTAEEMLQLLAVRLQHDRETELAVAAGEQAKITRLRLERLGK